VETRCPRLVYICGTHGFTAKLSLELLISNPLGLRVPVAPGRFGAVGPARQWKMQPPAVNARGARFGECGSLRSINPRRGKGESLTSSLIAAPPLPFAFVLRLRAPSFLFAALFAFACRR
jgi:hypothetical protein